ncbi:MAG: LptE family protein [Bacteroidetes bacterium]|nr:LptE family protein [Bacteroidota bacterium]
MKFSFVILFISFFYGCGVYSFTGASISPDVKTVSIANFPNQASLVQPSLSQIFTEKMKDKFVSQTNLIQTKSGGDLQFEGAITDYVSQPTAIQGNEQAALNRLTITVKVKFANVKDEKQNFETTFSRFSDYDSRKNLSAIEQELINEICNQLVDDIFNKAVINW